MDNRCTQIYYVLNGKGEKVLYCHIDYKHCEHIDKKECDKYKLINEVRK